LLYVLGALLGDGCIYFWKHLYQVWLVGEEEFASNFANKISSCIGRKVRSYPYRGRNVWFVVLANAELYFLLESVRDNPELLMQLVNQGRACSNALQLVEGFFDAEGCIKVIKEPSRQTPKICLDITNTEIRFQEVMRTCIKQVLGIDTRLVTQKDKRPNRKIVYHLRIYRKKDIQKFLKFIHTIKMKPEKSGNVERWLGKRNGDLEPTFEPSPVASPHRPS
jgi:hypothetical protein